MIKIFNNHNFNLRLISDDEITCSVHDQHLRWLTGGGAKIGRFDDHSQT